MGSSRIDLQTRDETQGVAHELEKISCAFRDYSQEQQRQLAEATKRAAALSSASVGFLITDATGSIEFANLSAQAIFSGESVGAASALVGTSFDSMPVRIDGERPSMPAFLASSADLPHQFAKGQLRLQWSAAIRSSVQ